MEDTIEGAFINEMREYQPFAKITDKDVTDVIDRAVRIKKRYPQLSYDVIADYYKLAVYNQCNQHEMWTGECNDEAANGLVSAIKKLGDQVTYIADAIRR
tara:strand:+ start:211 stop:510 length:300 start_codon:yes stop_codon:yes gene_type:complete